MRISREERLILIELFLFRESRGLLISTQFRPIFSNRQTFLLRERNDRDRKERKIQYTIERTAFLSTMRSNSNDIREIFEYERKLRIYTYIYIYIIKKFRRKRITRFTNLLRIFQIVPARRAASSPLRPSPIINTP